MCFWYVVYNKNVNTGLLISNDIAWWLRWCSLLKIIFIIYMFTVLKRAKYQFAVIIRTYTTPHPLVLVVLRGFAEELEVPTENRGTVGGLRHLHGCRPRFWQAWSVPELTWPAVPSCHVRASNLEILCCHVKCDVPYAKIPLIAQGPVSNVWIPASLERPLTPATWSNRCGKYWDFPEITFVWDRSDRPQIIIGILYSEKHRTSTERLLTRCVCVLLSCQAVTVVLRRETLTVKRSPTQKNVDCTTEQLSLTSHCLKQNPS